MADTKLSFCARVLHSAVYSVRGESWRRADRSTGSPGGVEVPSVNPHLLGFNPRLKQGSKLEQGWRCKAEILLGWLDNGNGCARAVCQVEQYMLHAKTFSGRIKGLLELKRGLLTGKRRKKKRNKKKENIKKPGLFQTLLKSLIAFPVVPLYPSAPFTSLPRLFLPFSACLLSFLVPPSGS